MSRVSQDSIDRFKRRIKTLRSHQEKCERASTHTKNITVPAQNTGLGPEKTSFFQALGLTTKISRGTIEILSDTKQCLTQRTKKSTTQCQNSLMELMKNKGTDESDGAEERTVLEQPSIKPPRKRRVKKNTDESDVADEEEALLLDQRGSRKPPKKRCLNKRTDESDGAGEQTVLEQPSIKPPRKRRVKKNTDESDVADEDEALLLDQRGSRKPPKKRRLTKCTDNAQKSPRRRWSEEEKSAVERRMGTFIAVRRVPGKEACMMCITQESPALKDRTWKDVKYFVRNKILRVNKKQF